MKTQKITYLLIGTALLFTLCGCAKFPSTTGTTGRQLVVTLKVRGKISPVDAESANVLRHYFIAFDNENNQNVGPLAALYPPYGGTGWVTSQNAQQSVGLTSFIQYDAANPQGLLYGVLPGSYFLNRTQPQPPINYEIIEGGSTIKFIVDLSQLATATIPVNKVKQLNVNFITTNSLPNANQLDPTRQIDGLGFSGQDYVTIDTTTDRIFQGTDTDAPNLAPNDPDLDIVAWTIEVQTVSSR